MKLFLFYVFIALDAIFLFSCEKETTDPLPAGPPCEVEKWGHIRVKNNQSAPITFYLDGEKVGTVNCCGASRVFEQKFQEGQHFAELEFEGVMYEQYVIVIKCLENQVGF